MHARNRSAKTREFCWILDKTESTRRLLDSIQTHDDPLHLSAHGEQLVHLLLAREEGHVPDVQRGAAAQFSLIFLGRKLREREVLCSVHIYRCVFS